MTPAAVTPRPLLRLAGLLCACLAAAAWLALSATPAAAHASLVSTTPADGASLDAGPDELVLEFSESVSVPSGGVRVYDSSGEPLAGVDAGLGEDPSVVVADVPDDLGDDTYIVTWQVTSADGHPVRGAFVFLVGDAAGASDELVADIFAGGDDGVVTTAAAVARWLEYAAVLLAAGGALFLARVRRTGDRSRLLGLVRRTALAGVVVTVVGVALQAALTSGAGLAGMVAPEALADTALSGYGASAAVRLLGLAALLAGLSGLAAGRAQIALVGAVVAAASFALTGHTLTTEPRWLVLTADVAHLLAAAVWFGGLALLLLALRHTRVTDDPVAAGGLVARFSALASVAIVVVGVAGLALAWVEVRVPRALVSTAYGWTMIAKLAVVALVAAIGVYNNRRLVPALARLTTATADLGDGVSRRVPAGGSDDAGATRGGSDLDAATRAWQRLRRTVGIEVVGIMAVLAVTAVLVNLPPAAEAAGVTGAYSVYEEMDEYLVNLTVDPNRAGRNEVHLYLLTPQGRPVADAVEHLHLELSLPEEDIGPIERAPNIVGPGHWLLVGNELSLPGRWEIDVVAQVSRFEQLTTTITVVVGG